MSAANDAVGPPPDPTGATARTSSDDVGVADLLGRLSDQFTSLLRQEVELAKAEVKQEVTVAAKAGAEFGAAAIAGHFALLFLSFAAAWGLAELMAPSLAFLIVGVIYVIGAAAAAMKGKKDAQDVDPNLNQTKESLQATAEWAKDKP